ncbi:hypothetical protein [Limnobacter sp.]|nr:hypothetical protein [Limnobacter sp.]MDP3187551.1 hypothetical protein [Limnobacter sp.]
MTSDITTNDLQHMQAELAGAEKPLDVMAAVGGVMDMTCPGFFDPA